MYGEKEFYSREFENCQYEDNAEGDRRWNMSRMTKDQKEEDDMSRNTVVFIYGHF